MVHDHPYPPPDTDTPGRGVLLLTEQQLIERAWLLAHPGKPLPTVTVISNAAPPGIKLSDEHLLRIRDNRLLYMHVLHGTKT